MHAMTIIPHDMYGSCGTLLRTWRHRHFSKNRWQEILALVRTFMAEVVVQTHKQPQRDGTPKAAEAQRRAMAWYTSNIADSWVDCMLAAFSLTAAAIALAQTFRSVDPRPFTGWCPTCIRAALHASSAATTAVRTHSAGALTSLQAAAAANLAALNLEPMHGDLQLECENTFGVVVCTCPERQSGRESLYSCFDFVDEDDVAIGDLALRRVWQTCIVGDFYLPYLRNLAAGATDDLSDDDLVDGEADASAVSVLRRNRRLAEQRSAISSSFATAAPVGSARAAPLDPVSTSIAPAGLTLGQLTPGVQAANSAASDAAKIVAITARLREIQESMKAPGPRSPYDPQKYAPKPAGAKTALHAAVVAVKQPQVAPVQPLAVTPPPDSSALDWKLTMMMDDAEEDVTSMEGLMTDTTLEMLRAPSRTQTPPQPAHALQPIEAPARARDAARSEVLSPVATSAAPTPELFASSAPLQPTPPPQRKVLLEIIDVHTMSAATSIPCVTTEPPKAKKRRRHKHHPPRDDPATAATATAAATAADEPTPVTATAQANSLPDGEPDAKRFKP